MSLPGISIRRPVFAWMLMTAIILFGLISFSRLGISQLPDVDFPVVGVSITENGAAPEIIESQILDPIEDALMQIDGIRQLSSNAQQGKGSISVEFELGRDMELAMQQVQNRINQVHNLLPADMLPPSIRKSNPEDQPILWLTVTATDPGTKLIDLMIYARDTLYDQFSTVSGVGNIYLSGYMDPALRVWMDLDKLYDFNLTSGDVISAIQEEHQEGPSGIIQNKKKEYSVRVLGETRTPAEFGKIAIQSRASQGANYFPTRLNQVAKVEEGLVDIRKISRFNGQLAVGLGLVKQHGANAVGVAKEIKKRFNELQRFVPRQFKLEMNSDNTRFIQQSVNELEFTLILSALLTSFICYLFLGSMRSTINVLLSIPTSIIGTFIAFYFLNFTLNAFTLLGLSLAIGIVVDDAIMMLENIVRYREMGQKRKTAALNGAEEITFAALAATVAVVAIFVPVVFMNGIIGRYFYQFGITVTVAVLLSLIEALTLTPMRCAAFMPKNHEGNRLARFMNRVFGSLAHGYRAALKTLLRNGWTQTVTIGGALMFFCVSLLIAKRLPGEMVPAQDQSQMVLRVKLPVGTSLAVTDKVMKNVEKFIYAQPEVASMFSSVGSYGGNDVNQAAGYVNLVPASQRKLSQAQLIAKLRPLLAKQNPSAEVVVQDTSLGGYSSSRGFPVEFVIEGPDWKTLTSVTSKIMAEMKKTELLVDVNTDIQPNMAEVQITPNRYKLAEHAVSLNTVTQALNTLLGGNILTGTTEYTKGRHRYAIEARLRAQQRDRLPDIEKIQVRNNRGETVPLSELVDLRTKPSLVMITRLNRSRAITVYSNVAPGRSQQDALARTQEIAHKFLPPGYFMKLTGGSRSLIETFQSLVWALLLGILVSYMVLASQFNSFIHPVTVLVALPFSFSGAFIGLWLGHQSINMYSLIGFVLLMGIVKKNSILLVDFTNQVRNEGLDAKAALLKACPIRLRPILMTSIATVAAALPEAFSMGPGAETTAPMAISIIGGVVASTLLTLFVVPCVYNLLSPRTVL